MPLGPEFNPASTVGALNRPEVSTLLQFHCRLTNLVEMNDSFSFYFYFIRNLGLLDAIGFVRISFSTLHAFAGDKETWCNYKTHRV